MATKNRHNEKQDTATAETVIPADDKNRQYVAAPETAGDAPAQLAETSNATVDQSTGEVHGEGHESQPIPDVDVVALPKKIVAKDIIGRAGLKMTKEAIKKEDGSIEWNVSPPRDLYTVFGTASGTEQGTTTYGEWIGFTGTFEAVRTEDGQRFRSNRLILQEPAQTLLLNALTEVKKRDSSGSVNFAFEVGIRVSQRWVDTNEGMSYEYTIKSVFNVQQHDPLAHMRHSLRSVLPPPRPKQLTHDAGNSGTSDNTPAS